MATLDELMELLKQAETDGNYTVIPAEQVDLILKELTKVLDRLQQHKELLTLQRQAMVRANRIFKRANKWPAYQYPDMSTLIDWLLDHYSRRQAVKFQLAMEEVLQKLFDLGSISLDEAVVVPGKLIISLRTKLYNTLQQAYEQNTPYLYEEQKPSTTHSAEEDETGDEGEAFPSDG
jgi:hypothetical protein